MRCPIHRVALRLAGPDPRIALRASSPDPELFARLERMGPWTYEYLELIRDRPEVRAADLAESVGRERVDFKRDVRRLKELGLTESLDRVLTGASPAASAEVTRLLASPRFADSPVLTAAAIGELTARAGSAGGLDTATAVAVSTTLTAQGAGDGLTRLESSSTVPLATPALVQLAAGNEWRAVDSDLRAAPKEELTTVAVRRLGTVRDPTPVRPVRPRRPASAKATAGQASVRKTAKAPGKRKKAGDRT